MDHCPRVPHAAAERAPDAPPPSKKRRTDAGAERTTPQEDDGTERAPPQEDRREAGDPTPSVRGQQLAMVFALAGQARPGSPQRIFLAAYHNRVRQGWTHFTTVTDMRDAISEEWLLLIRHAPWTPATVEIQTAVAPEVPDAPAPPPPRQRQPRGPRVICCQWLKSNANRPVLEDECRAKNIEFTKKTTRFQLAALAHSELPDFCDSHNHKRR